MTTCDGMPPIGNSTLESRPGHPLSPQFDHGGYGAGQLRVAFLTMAGVVVGLVSAKVCCFHVFLLSFLFSWPKCSSSFLSSSYRMLPFCLVAAGKLRGPPHCVSPLPCLFFFPYFFIRSSSFFFFLFFLITIFPLLPFVRTLRQPCRSSYRFGIGVRVAWHVACFEGPRPTKSPPLAPL